MLRFIVVSFCLLFSFQAIVAQQAFIIVSGQVTNQNNGEPLPFVNVVLDGRFIGTSTDTLGKYTLKIPKTALKATDTLLAASLGFRPSKKKLDPLLMNQVINFQLGISDVQLNEIVIKGDDPAVLMFRKIQENRTRNNPENLQTASYENYTKYELDLDGITKKSLQNDRIMKNFPFLQQYLDTTTERGKSMLPFFLVENLSNVFTSKNPEKYTERIEGVKISGIKQEDFITELLGNVNQHVNIYENTISALGKSFVSPLSDFGLSTYRYFLFYNDTLSIDGKPCLELEFKPRHRGENTLKGKMLVNLQTFAIASIEAEMTEGQNTGILEGLSLYQDFKPQTVQTKDSVQTLWLPNKEYLSLKMNYYVSKETKIIGRKSKSYRNWKANQPIDEKLFQNLDATEVEASAYEKDDTFWEQKRHELLLEKEKGIYSMVDSVKRTTAFKLISYASRAMATGYMPAGKISFGPFANVFSRNQIEQVRFRMGIQTTDKFSKRTRLMAFGAYGLADERFKYGGKFEFIFTRKPWNKITLFARNDIDFMSRHSSEMDYDNVFTLIQKRTQQRLYNITEYKVTFDHEFHRDLTAYLTVQHQEYNPLFDFTYLLHQAPASQINTTEFGVLWKYQRNASALSGKFNKEAKANRLFAKFRKKNPAPVIYLRYFTGVKGILGSSFNYHDLSLGLESELQVTPKQSLFYCIWGGQIFGELPFLLLKNPSGNFAHVYNKYMFQNMSLLEFTADRYISGNFDYTLGGALFDKIPLWRKLKLTEALTCNVFYGSLSEKNRKANELNTFKTAYPIPYVEAGAGIANIFKFIRIDGVWRFTHLNQAREPFFVVYASLFIKV